MLGFWAMVHIARVLGTDLFGALGFATAFIAYFELISRQGLDTYGIQAVARQPALAGHYAGLILALRLTAAAAAYLVLTLAAWGLGVPPVQQSLILLGGLCFFTAATSPQWVFQALEEMRFAAAARMLSTFAFALAVLMLVNQPAHVLRVPFLQFASEAVAVVWLLTVFRRRCGLPRPAFDAKAWRAILRESLPLGIEGIFGVVLFNLDMVMLGFLRPAAEAGEYSAAYKFINFAAAFVFLYGANLLPLISRSRGDPGALRAASDKLFQYTLLLAVPVAAGGTLLAQDLVNLIFGSRFSAAAGALRILLWVIPLVTCKVVFRNTLLSHGGQRALLWCTFAAAAVNAAGNALLIPRFSYIGSAFTTVASEAVLLLLLSMQVAGRVVPLPFLRHAWKPALASAAMVLLLAGAPEASVPLRIGAGILVYFGAAWILGAFRVREILRVRASEWVGE